MHKGRGGQNAFIAHCPLKYILYSSVSDIIGSPVSYFCIADQELGLHSRAVGGSLTLKGQPCSGNEDSFCSVPWVNNDTFYPWAKWISSPYSCTYMSLQRLYFKLSQLKVT